MAGIGMTSSSGYGGGVYQSMTQGPGGGMGMNPAVAGGGPGGFMEMAQSLLAEKRRAAEEARAREAMRLKMEQDAINRAEAEKKSAKMEKNKRKGYTVDPMRYANQAAQAARNAQATSSGKGGFVQDFGQSVMAGSHAADQAREQAFAAYPAYLAMMQGG
jgi:hypothetical protein